MKKKELLLAMALVINMITNAQTILSLPKIRNYHPIHD